MSIHHFILADILHPWFSLGNFPIYNLLVGIALVAAILTFSYSKDTHLSEDFQENFTILAPILAGIAFLGGNVWSWFFYPEVWKKPLIDRFLNSGFSLIFGFIIFFLLVGIFCLLKRVNTNTVFNALTPSLLLAHCFGRLGCALAGCCFGREIDLYFVHRFPARELEMLFTLLLFTQIYQIPFSSRFRVYVLSYSSLRFFLEFFRADNRGHFLTQFFSPSQEICILVLGFWGPFFLFQRFRSKLSRGIFTLSQIPIPDQNSKIEP